MKIFSKYVMGAAMAAMAAGACTEDSPVTNPPVEAPQPVEIARGGFACGADVSWLTEMEKGGATFATADGTPMECMQLLRDHCGVNSIRLRVWVDPEDGWCNTDDVVLKARRATLLGMRVMIDFHFSDWWADPGKQNMPAAWADMDLEGVKGAMTAHVNEMLTKLDDAGIEPEWVQIGNETRTGMMWPMGSIDTGDNFTQMVNTGYDAVKAVFPDCAVIVHCDEGNSRYLYDRLFGKLADEGARYDMIGMSLYPEPAEWESTVAACVANIDYVQKTFGKPVMICEIGMDYREADKAKAMMAELMARSLELDVKGIFWWEPQTDPASGYMKGCFDGGAPTAALDPFVDFSNSSK